MSDQNTFKALADTTRRDILRLLAGGSLSAGDIADHFNISKPSLSHHFSALKQADLVRSHRDGHNIIYTLNTTVLEETARFMLDIVDQPAIAKRIAKEPLK